MVRTLSELQERPAQPAVNIGGALFRACFYGDIPPEEFLKGEGSDANIFDLLLIAEAHQKQGRLNEAASIYEHLLSGKLRLTENQWFLANSGMALNMFKEGREEASITEIRSLIDRTENKILKAYGKLVLARILSSHQKLEECLELYNSIVKAFDHHGIPLLSCIAHNNRGVAYYRLERLEDAMIEWEKAIKFAKKAKSDYSEATIFTNTSDMHGLSGNPELGMKQLQKARTIFERMNDLEGLSGVEFNLSLLLLDKKELNEAVEHFRTGQSIAFPLPPPIEREERVNYFIRRGRLNGFDNIDPSSIDP